MAVVSGLDRLGVPVVMVTRPLSRSLSVTQGKGLSLVAAKVSGIMEAVEHAHAEEIELPLRLATERALRRSSRVLSPSQLNLARPGYHADTSLLWVRGRTSREEQAIWVPYDAVHLDACSPTATGPSWLLSSSNGLASGNGVAEAIAHGLFEVLERHLTCEFYDLSAAEQEALRLDLTTIRDEPARSLLRQLADVQVEVCVWDISGGLGVPCFFCELLDREEDVVRGVPRARGMGCHSDRQVALLRAVTEAVQSRITLIAGSRDDIVDVGSGARRADIASAHRQQRARSSLVATRSFDQVASSDFEDFDAEVSWLSSRLEQAGLGAAAVVDLSKGGLPVSVVRVLVPGARLSSAVHSRGT